MLFYKMKNHKISSIVGKPEFVLGLGYICVVIILLIKKEIRGHLISFYKVEITK